MVKGFAADQFACQHLPGSRIYKWLDIWKECIPGGSPARGLLKIGCHGCIGMPAGCEGFDVGLLRALLDIVPKMTGTGDGERLSSLVGSSSLNRDMPSDCPSSI